jgi:hypothetical protein
MKKRTKLIVGVVGAAALLGAGWWAYKRFIAKPAGTTTAGGPKPLSREQMKAKYEARKKAMERMGGEAGTDVSLG